MTFEKTECIRTLAEMEYRLLILYKDLCELRGAEYFKTKEYALAQFYANAARGFELKALSVEYPLDS